MLKATIFIFLFFPLLVLSQDYPMVPNLLQQQTKKYWDSVGKYELVLRLSDATIYDADTLNLSYSFLDMGV